MQNARTYSSFARYKIFVLSILLAAGFATTHGCRKNPEPDRQQGIDPTSLDGAAAYQQVQRFVELGPRDSGTPGAERAANHIASRLKEMGVEVVTDSFENVTPKGVVTFRNVLGVINGTRQRTLVIASHYDTKSGISDNFVGANDSGSSTGLLLELARCIKAAGPLPADMVLAFFDGEECMIKYGAHDGLHGSKRMVETLVKNQRAKNVLGVILLDMVGDADLQIAIPRNAAPQLVSHVFTAATEEGRRDKFALLRKEVLDDHVPFLLAGIPAVDLIDFAYGSAPGLNDYWHTDEDTMEKISDDSLELVGRVVLRTINRILFTPQ